MCEQVARGLLFSCCPLACSCFEQDTDVSELLISSSICNLTTSLSIYSRTCKYAERIKRISHIFCSFVSCLLFVVSFVGKEKAVDGQDHLNVLTVSWRRYFVMSSNYTVDNRMWNSETDDFGYSSVDGLMRHGMNVDYDDWLQFSR